MSSAVAVRPTGDALDVMVIVRELMQRPDFSIEMLKELLALREKEELRQAEREFQYAFARCQAQVTRAKRDEDNPLFRSKYASIEAMYDAVWPHVTDQGFDWTVSAMPVAPPGWDNSVLWFQGTLSRDVAKRTVELPVSRDALKAEVGSKGGKPAMTSTQAIGALTTYMRKYLLGLMFSVVTEEDIRTDKDGNGHDKGKGPRDRPDNGGGKPPDPLDEPNGHIRVKNLDALLHQAQTRQAVTNLRVDRRVASIAEAPETPVEVKQRIAKMFEVAYARFDDEDEAKIETPGPPPDDPREQINREVPFDPPKVMNDPSLDLLAELKADVERMDLITIAGLPSNAQWRAKVRELMPQDEDTLNEAIAARSATLKARQ